MVCRLSLFAVPALLLLPFQVVAQSPARGPWAMFGGVGIQFGEDEYPAGLQFGGRFTAMRRAPFVLHLDLAYQTFGTLEGRIVTEPCPSSCPASTGTGDHIKILSTGANVRLGGADDPAWVLGLGLYGAVETPHDGSYIRPGWNFGFTTSSMSAPLFFELRLHGMTGRQRTRGFTLLTIGARF